jgi:predicted RNA-binding Zn-ribbon protein involved in translation (DUF1610 family)
MDKIVKEDVKKMKCERCGTEMLSSAVREYVPDHDSYGSKMKRVTVGRWHKCQECGFSEYEKVR